MAKQKNQLYEGMYILSTTLSDEARQKALDKILGGISERGGEVHKIHDQGRRKLAYEINGKRDGHYYLLYFSVVTPAIKDMWREYHLNEDLVRFLTLRTEKVLETLEFKPIVQE
ncbi:MAG: 30S ribosomal protein S6 [Chlamydiales bacterium]